MVATYAPDVVQPGTMRLDALSANKINVQLVKDAKGSQSPSKAHATGGVAIKARRADRVTSESGQIKTILRDVRATAKEASLVQSEDQVVLTGDVIVTITEPGVEEPLAVITGDKVTVFLKENRFRVEGQSGKQAEMSVTTKEGEKK
jgi:lipopolysaccharide export system protein LptA